MKTAIRARVSEQTITKVTRLFNGSLLDILTELLQNARRAGASSVDVNWQRAPGEPKDSAIIQISVSDDGKGIADPQSVLSLGESSWDATITGEDPAGMGFFSLAGRDVIITSRARGHRPWSAHIRPEDWTGEHDIAVNKAVTPFGTTIHFKYDLAGSSHLHAALGKAAKYFPLPVRLNGESLDQTSWIENAIHTTKWRGSSIAVVAIKQRYQRETLNFFGLTISADLPVINDTQHNVWSVVVDIAPNSGLSLVLPARKEIVQNQAYEDLKTAATRAIYEAIAHMGTHHLPYDKWLEARALGVELPEAAPLLYSWTPDTADSGTKTYGDLIDTQDAIVVSELYPLEAHSLARAATLNENAVATLKLVASHSHYRGYTWYDALPLLEAPVFEIELENKSMTLEDGIVSDDNAESQIAKAIRMVLTTTNTAKPMKLVLKTDLAATQSEDAWWMDNITVFWTKSDTLNPMDLADMLEAALFQYNDDCEADSYETQLSNFQDEAITTAIRLLGTRSNLLAHRLLQAINPIRWDLGADETITIVIDKDKIDVAVSTS